MKSLVVDEKGTLYFEELPIPEYHDCQALVKMLSCGVCNGTDLKIIHGKFKNFHTYPAALGHEGVGEVVAVGRNVKNLQVGDRVLLPFLETEVNGIYPGWGAFSEYALVGDVQAYVKNGKGPGTEEFSEGYYAQTKLKPQDEIDDVGASMIITFREVLSAIRRFGCQPNKNILIFGAGPVGLCFTRFCKLLGLSNVVTVDIEDCKVEQAKSMGADYVFNSTTVDLTTEIKTLFPDGMDYIVDAVGMTPIINQAMELLTDGGKICCYGISPQLNMQLDWSKAPYNWSLDFVQWPSKQEEAEAHTQIMAWIHTGVLNPHDFISDVIGFSDIKKAFEKVENKQSGLKKIVIKF